MKKTIFLSILLGILGLAAGAGLLLAALTYGWLPGVRASISFVPTASAAVGEETPGPAQPDLSDQSVLVERALETARLIRDRDWAALADAVHPEEGVTFTPYSSVEDRDLNFTPDQVAAFGSDPGTYLWGYTDGSGFPLELTPAEYFDRYVFNTDYTQAPYLAVNRVISRGNALENVADAYPDASFVEFFFPGLVAVNDGFDWCALKLVFRPWEGQLMLVGVIHSEWTI